MSKIHVDYYSDALSSIVICNSYNTGKSALPDIYARCTRGRVRIYQAKHECLCYN